MAVEKELPPLQGLLFLSRLADRLAASKLTGDGASIVVAVSVLQVAPCTEQCSVQLQHGTAGPAAHQGALSGSHTHTHLQGVEKKNCETCKATPTTTSLHKFKNFTGFVQSHLLLYLHIYNECCDEGELVFPAPCR